MVRSARRAAGDRARAELRAGRAGALLVATLLAGCGPAEEPAPPAGPATGSAPARPAGPSGEAGAVAPTVIAGGIALPATFAGQLPCADCEGIDTTLTLDADFRFRQRSRYLGKPPGQDTFVTAGRFSVSDAGRRLALHGTADGATIFAVQGPDQLTRLDTGGQPIASQLNYTLKRAPALDAIEEPGRVLGLFTYFADAPSFVDCATEERLPVAMRDDYLALEKAYTAAGAAGTPRLVRLRAHIEPAVGMEESQGPQPMLIVDKFEELVGSEVRCQRTQAPLAGTRWVLTRLGDRALPADAQAVPDLRFDPAGERLGGSTGCNAMSGGYDYSIASGALTVGSIAVTAGDCPAGAVDETAYTMAIQRATSAAIRGEELVLADEQGELAAFRADYPAPPPRP